MMKNNDGNSFMARSIPPEGGNFGYDRTMRTQPERISRLILDQLAMGEMGSLVLLVAVRRAMGGAAPFKGDLAAAVKAALRKLVASQSITEVEGVYSIAMAVK